MPFLLNISKIIMSFIYFFLKLFPIKNKITLISRQTNSPSIDFLLIEKEIKKQNKKVKVIFLTKKIEGYFVYKINFFLLIKVIFSNCFHVLKQMFHIATSKAVIVDSYCIPISVLKHKKRLIIIQIWHALGAIKKFGYSILDETDGNSSKRVKVLNMHKNYTYMISGSKEMVPFFAQAFNISEKQIIPYSMPRVDYLLDQKIKSTKKSEILKEYKSLKQKKTILYIPTFRDNESLKIEDLTENIDYDKFNLIIKIHPKDKTQIKNIQKVIVDKKFPTLDLLFIADYVITDYSAVAFEASVLKIPMFFYVYDIEKYSNDRGLFIDYYKEMPGFISKSGLEIAEAIKNEKIDMKKIKNFRKKYIEVLDGTSTKKIVDLLKIGDDNK